MSITILMQSQTINPNILTNLLHTNPISLPQIFLKMHQHSSLLTPDHLALSESKLSASGNLDCVVPHHSSSGTGLAMLS